MYILPTVNRISNWVSGEEVFFLYICHAVSVPIIGFVNSIIYGMDKQLIESWKTWITLGRESNVVYNEVDFNADGSSSLGLDLNSDDVFTADSLSISLS